ncbi:MAG TPA: GMC family oxidoreductase [Bryobacteraceae bacterium]|jgi:choline dehydrogenase-like flavoprotein|nr:GMC family oxidoreductase [Bryobacteraceae bacterium]
MQVQASPQVHDVIIIGSGAAGGMAAWNLTRQGINVTLLDAGRKFNRREFWTHVKPWEWQQRLDAGEKPPPIVLDPVEQPYITPLGQEFQLTRVWGRGGKTNIWGRVSLRYSDLDFEGPARDGWEIPWPIRYKDIGPYYDKVDQLIGVCGGDEDVDSLPGSKYFLPPPPLRCGEHIIKNAAASIGIQTVRIRRAVLTRDYNGHPHCHYCGACGEGCDVGAFFNASDYLLEPALKTGKLNIIDNAVAARILVDDRGLASGVQYFDRNTKEEHRIYGKRVVVAASCVDSSRILLNSTSPRYPNGIGNSSDVIGRYLSEQIRFSIYGFAPQLIGGKVYNDDGIGGAHIYMPRFNHRDGRKRDYLRGFGCQFWYTGAQNDVWWAKTVPGFGADFKRAVKERYPAVLALHPFGEAIPKAENRITVKGSPLDRYGVPIARIAYQTGENERRMSQDMYNTILEIMHAAKAEIVPFHYGSLEPNGSAIHEHGTCRMGDDPKRSALNAFNQMHDVKNVFVVDGSAFTTASEKNPTLTILALSWRATDYMADQIRQGNI